MDEPAPSKEEIFYKQTLRDGTSQWKMADRLEQISRSCIKGGFRTQEALVVLQRLSAMVEDSRWFIRDPAFQAELEYVQSHAFVFFVQPIADILSKRNSGLLDEAERLKQQALDWFRLLIDDASSPGRLEKGIEGSLEEQRIAGLIWSAYSLCVKLDRIPYKKEVWVAARARDKKMFLIGADTETNLLKKAGLDGLPQARRGHK